MNAFVRPAEHVFIPIDEIDLSHTIRPYNAAVVAELAQSIRAIGLQTPLIPKALLGNLWGDSQIAAMLIQGGVEDLQVLCVKFCKWRSWVGWFRRLGRRWIFLCSLRSFMLR